MSIMFSVKMFVIKYILLCVKRYKNKEVYDEIMTIDMNTRYFNASKLCNIHGKRINKWLNDTKTKELIKYYNKLLFINNRGSKHNILSYYYINNYNININDKNSKKLTKGLYLHPYMLKHLLNWINNK
ncbi:N1R/p28-like protein [Mythimna separata entomopoxvirus 'L']|uniref:N1R/p28-like protein n=1 Tax=Mythimna separata entomopoxvirus 'L' TaxID=1293572 RepID=A0A916P1U2_9POXV|nr:N1R/p28-like protein [Mythimna separata entomopoxvirus 'L']CCU56335.1 N1R/p28-like protein [Mythimna separata entomopoxvirus 'L']